MHNVRSVTPRVKTWLRTVEKDVSPHKFGLLIFFRAVTKIQADVVCCIAVSTILSNQSVNHY